MMPTPQSLFALAKRMAQAEAIADLRQAELDRSKKLQADLKARFDGMMAALKRSKAIIGAIALLLGVSVVQAQQGLGAKTLLQNLAAPAPTAPNLSVLPPAPAVAAAPAPVQIENAVRVTLAWQPPDDATVVGYKVYWAGNTAQTTNTSLTIKVSGGSTNIFYVVSMNAAGIESVPSNKVTYEAPQPLLASLSPAVWRYETLGYFGKTNRIQSSTNLTDWLTWLTFIGRGSPTNILRTNRAQEFFRTIAD